MANLIKKTKLLSILILSVVALLVVGCSTNSTSNSTSTPLNVQENSKPVETPSIENSASLSRAPLFDKTTVSGKSFSLQSNIDMNKATVVYFMASTCTTCAKNWKAVNEVLPEFEGKVDFIAISVDPTDSNEVLAELAANQGFIFESVAGDPELAVEYEVFKQTAKFAIDKNGNIVDRHDGALSADEWRNFFNKALGDEMLDLSMKKDEMMDDKDMMDKEMSDEMHKDDMMKEDMKDSMNYQKAPLFDKTTVNGEQFSLQSNIDMDKATVVYFMASTCTTCAKNWDAVNEILSDYEDKVDFIAISVDPTDSNEVLAELAEDRNFKFDTISGDPELAVEYEVFKQTAKFAIDKNGNIIDRHDGALSADEWREFFDLVA